MHKNPNSQQLTTFLNQGFNLQSQFPLPNSQRFRRPIERHTLSTMSSFKSLQKKQYLTLVSKDKKSQKRATLKSSKKNKPKKIQSVVLGGQKTTNYSVANTEKSLESSLCRSCTSLQQKVQIITNSTPKSSIINAQPYLQPVSIIMKPQDAILIRKPQNEHLNRMISQKLNLDNHVQIPGRLSLNVFQAPQRNETVAQRFGGKLIRNTASAGKIYFSVGNPQQKMEQRRPEQRMTVYTPKFDKSSPEKERKRRKNAGFIRSASTPKISYSEACKLQQNESIPPSEVPFDKRTKQLEISKCLEKMSSIRKQIDELQDFLHDRLLSSQLKSKYLYNRSSSCMKDRQTVENQVSFSTIPVESKVQNKESNYTPINSIILESTCQAGQKYPLMEAKNQSLNASSVTSKLGHSHILSQQLQPFSSIQNLYHQKCPSSNKNSGLQKHIISEISLKNHSKLQKSNQQNFFYPTNSFHSIM